VLLKTILNSIEKYKGFVYKDIKLVGEKSDLSLEVKIEPRRGSRGVCRGCGDLCSCYDTRGERRYEYIPLWGMAVFFLYCPRRLNCPDCGIHVEQVPWAVGKNRLTQRYAWFLSCWAKRLSWKETAQAFGTSWHHVYSSVEMAVSWGLKHRTLEDIKSIGVDEIAWRKGHKYQTLVYQIDSHCKRLLWIGSERTEKTLHGFFDELGTRRSGELEYVCSFAVTCGKRILM
jgi:transposase